MGIELRRTCSLHHQNYIHIESLSPPPQHLISYEFHLTDMNVELPGV